MDDPLFQRFLSGDPLAATGVRNHLRAVAHRILAAPQWEMPDNDVRRERESAAVAETIQSPGHSMVQAASRAMAISIRIGLDHLRHIQGLPQGHISTDLLARKAVDKTQEDEKEQVRTHLEDCPACRRHLELARSALKAAMSTQAVNPISTAKLTPSTDRRPTPRQKTRRTKVKKQSRVPGSEWITQGIILVGLFFAVYLFTRPSQAERDQTANLERAKFLPGELPPTAMAGEFEGNVEASIQLMSNGRCGNAADRLVRFVERGPEDRLLRYYFSLALLCDRRSPDAMQSFAILHKMEGERFWGEAWWRAQALYLAGAEDKAMTVLDQIAESQHGRAADAEALLQRIIASN